MRSKTMQRTAFITLLFLAIAAQDIAAGPAFDSLSPRLHLPEPVISDTFTLFSSPGLRSSVWLTAVDTLLSPDISEEKKLEYVLSLAEIGPITDTTALRRLRQVREQNRDNPALRLAIGTLLIRNNPSFWLDEEYVRVDKEKFLAMVDRRNIHLSGAEEFFLALEGLAQVKEDFLACNSQNWRYPYSCMHLSAIALMEELRKYSFVSMLMLRKYPQESDFFGFHAYLRAFLKTEISRISLSASQSHDQEGFTIDLSATQFHKLDPYSFFETGIVIIPDRDILQDPDKFKIYTAGKSTFMFNANPGIDEYDKETEQLLAWILNRGRQGRNSFLHYLPAGFDTGGLFSITAERQHITVGQQIECSI